ncbi:hypothetical protein JCM3774_000630 [Rhodotorula dairenensis]
MGKVRHRKRTRDARVQATQLPLTGTTASNDHQHQHQADAAAAAPAATVGMKKGARRDADMAQLLEQLKSQDGRERTMASATLAGLVLSLPPLQLRLLLSKNLIGLLIERVAILPTDTAAAAAAASSSPPPPPPSHDLATAIESLGALRNLAVSGPTHLLSEMHNKRMLQPLVAVHLPLLARFLPVQLGPAPPAVKPTMPATAADRRAAEDTNEANDTLRRSFWDWAENTLTLLWCLAESNTKILTSLNQHAQAIVALCVAFLQHAIDFDLDGTAESDAASKGKGKQQQQQSGGARKSRVPLYVAVAAAQTLHAFVSSNPAAHSQLLSPPGSYTFSPSLSVLLSILSSPSPPGTSASASSASSGAAADAAEEWAQLRVLAFGVLLEIAKGRSKRRDVETVREHLRTDEAQQVLLELVREADLSKAVTEGKAVAGQIDPAALPARATDSSSPNARLASLERRAQTLQLALEVLSEWLASGVPNAALLANAGEVDDDGMMDDGDLDVTGDEEEWGGAAMDVEDDDEVMMGGAGDDEDGGLDDADASAVIKQEQDGVIRRRRGDTPEAVARRMAGAAAGDDEDDLDDDAMLDDLAATADSDAEDLADADETTATNGSVLLAASLPMQLLALSRPSTELSFVPSTAFAENPAAAAIKGSSNGLISTSVAGAAGAQYQPAALSTLSETITTIHVRAIEALNNLYVTLSRGKKARRDPKELQEVFETTLGLVQGALEAAATNATAPTTASSGAGTTKKGKAAGGGGSGTAGKQQEDEVDEVQERRREVVMAGMGVVWGCTILGLDPERSGKLVVGPDTTPFLIQHVYPSAFAAAQTPAGEAIRVRTLGALGWIGRRKGVSAEENATIGRFMLSLLPASRTAVVTNSVPSTVAATPDLLLEAIDSFIDLYADEERDYDVPVFRQGGMLDELEKSVQGVRAAIKKIDKSKFPELRARADGNLNNLVAFVQYRKDILKTKR